MWVCAVTMSSAHVHPFAMRTISRPAELTRRAGACQNRQRIVLGAATASAPSQHKSWNQREVGGPAHDLQPRLVRVEVGEREPFEAGVFQPGNVVLDMRVSADRDVETTGSPAW